MDPPKSKGKLIGFYYVRTINTKVEKVPSERRWEMFSEKNDKCVKIIDKYIVQLN